MPSTDSDNPYAPPRATLEEPRAVEPPGVLASRWRRLGAAWIDSFAGTIAQLPLMYAMGMFDDGFFRGWSGHLRALTTQQGMLLSGAGFVLWLMIHGHFLVTGSQTLGKRLLGMRIVNVSDGVRAPVQKLVLLRELPLWALAQLPDPVGHLVLLVDTLFIFRRDRRCVHDWIAGTRVVWVPQS